MNDDTVREEVRDLPVWAEADVVVCGGGPAGLGAALAAAHAGAQTLLVERYGFLGGMATAGLVTGILGHVAEPGDVVVEGLVREWVERMHALGGAPAWEDAVERKAIHFDPEACKRACDLMAEEAGVRLLLHGLVCGASTADGRLDAVALETKQGRMAVRGGVFIDATGDADVAFRAGLPHTKGRPFDGRPMAAGSLFQVEGIDPEVTGQHADRIRERFEQARRSGRITSYSGLWVGDGVATLRLNKTRAAADCADAADLTRAEIEVRRQSWEMVEFFRRELPGFENCRLARTPAHVGVRETRQALGDYVMTGEDILEARKQPDGIARAAYWIDIHCPYGYTWPAHVCRRDCPMGEDCKILREAPEQLPPRLHAPEGGWADVPYRSLTVRGAGNLLSAGRCISADHHAMGAIRVIAICMAIGQAAGTAAAMAAADGSGDVRAVDVDALRAGLTEAGGRV